MKDGNLDRAVRKAKWHYGRVWCGYFTPSEILALIRAGVRPTDSQDWVVKDAERRIKAGDGSCNWLYFYPNGVEMVKHHYKVKK